MKSPPSTRILPAAAARAAAASAAILLASSQLAPGQGITISRVIATPGGSQVVTVQADGSVSIEGGEAVPVAPPTAPGNAGPPAAPAAAAPKSPEQQRLAKFLKIKFDRRQSVILRAIIEEETKGDDEVEPAEDAAAEAAPADPGAGGEAPAEPEPPAEGGDAPAAAPEISTGEVATAPGEKSETAAGGAPTKAGATTPTAPGGTAGAAAAKKDAIDLELEAFQRDVTLGRWGVVKAYLARFQEEENGKKAYLHLLKSLLTPIRPKPTPPRPGEQPTPAPQPAYMEKHVLLPDDVLSLADASPQALEPERLALLGKLLSAALARGNFLDGLLERLDRGTGRLGGEDPEARKSAALLLVSAGRALESGRYLPSPEEAEKAGDREALNLLARYYLAVHAKDKEPADLERAWQVTQAVLADPEAGEEEREEALERALDLAPKVDEALGKTWLEESFTEAPERGIEILATVGAITSKNRHQRSAEFRLKKLQLQSRAVEALLAAAPARARDWAQTINLLALNWLRESELSRQRDTTQSRSPNMRFDRYGNMYYDSAPRSSSGNAPAPIATGELLDIQPGEAWLEWVDASLRPRFKMVFAQLLLKVKEEEKAFPFIEALAATHPEEALELANEFIDVWRANHDPNTERNRYSSYMYIYGYNRRAEGIPLTRSKQVRNLEELSGWVKRLRALPIGDLDERRLARAFTSTHSVAEVFKLEDIERVFGDVGTLKPKTLAELAQTMRRNLAGVWRQPDTQKKNKTNRKDKEIEAEVFRGYWVAGEVLRDALDKFPDAWELHLAKAAIAFDELNYRHELEQSPTFAVDRAAAYGDFRKAAELYAAGLPELSQKDESTDVYEVWFYASLGASDLGGLRAHHQADPRQPPLVRAALEALPADAAERHLDRFANNLVARMAPIKPELKHRYLKGGLEIAGDQKKARQARQLFAYYDDLVSEIRLHARIDGSDVVGHGSPFGLFVNIRHTKEVEREAGGFNRYLQNQQSSFAYYNYGRPQVNYREKFEEFAREALSESFEVLSVTFHSEKIQSRGDPEEGWRRTPYAYLLLQAKGPEVDEVPSIQMDFDFLDTTGYVVLPIGTQRIPVDASAKRGGTRPLADLAVTQTLDEREAGEGKLILEVKASGHGLIPDLEDLLDLDPGPFHVVETDDQGVAVVQLEAETEEDAVLTQRLWTIKLAADPGLAAPPTSFTFAAVKPGFGDEVETVYQRYEDADLAEVGREVALAASYGGGAPLWRWALALVVLGALGVAFYFHLLRRERGPDPVRLRFQLPEEITPFTTLQLLRTIRQDGRLADGLKADLDAAIDRLEQHFYSGNGGAGGDSPDLHALAQDWVHRAA